MMGQSNELVTRIRITSVNNLVIKTVCHMY